MSNTVVLITGANRGIGRGLLELYLNRPNHTVITANRDPSHASSQEILSLPRAEGTVVHVIKIDATVPTDAAAGAQELAALGINHLDIVIANAAVGYQWPKVVDVKTDDIQKHIVPNVYGFLWLWQAMWPLLKAAESPRWVTIGSSAAYLTNMIPFSNAAYAPTKLMVHWYTKAIHLEEPWLTALVIDPGWVQTDLGNRAANWFGHEKAAITMQESVSGIIGVVDKAKRATHSGNIWTHDGKQESW